MNRQRKKTAPAAQPRSLREANRPTGNWNPDWEPFATIDPAWTEKVIAMAIAPKVTGALDPRTIELIGVAVDASHMNAAGIRRHVRRALEAGATKQEITAALQLASLQGLHSFCLGAPILLEELEMERGLQRIAGSQRQQTKKEPR